MTTLLYLLLSVTVLVLCLVAVFLVKASRRPLLLAVVLVAAWTALLAIGSRTVAVSDAAVLLGAVGGAVLLSRLLRDNAAVVSFLAAATIADLYSYLRGPWRALLDGERGRTLLQYLAIAVTDDTGTVLVVGIADLLVAGAAFAALVRLRHPRWRVALILIVALGAAVILGTVVGGMPAIAFLAVAVLVEQALARRYGPVETTAARRSTRRNR